MFGPGGSAAGPKPGRDGFSVELGRDYRSGSTLILTGCFNSMGVSPLLFLPHANTATSSAIPMRTMMR